jgi:hypothetical protein
MTIGKNRDKLRVHVYVNHYGSPSVWEPYKTLIGYGRGDHLIIDDVGEQLYGTQGFDTKEAAMRQAQIEALKRILEKFPNVPESRIEWKFIEESAGKI